MNTQRTLSNREGDVLVTVLPVAEHHVTSMSQAVESCYRSEGFDKLLWNSRYVALLNELNGVTARSYDLSTGEVKR